MVCRCALPPRYAVRMDAALMWFRRDLRLQDNAALFHALKHARRVYGVFVFDRNILDPLRAAGCTVDRRVAWIHASVTQLQQALREHGSDLWVRHGIASDEVVNLARALKVDAVFTNEDYEPDARARDAAVALALAQNGQRLECFKDQVIFAEDEVLTGAGKPFSVFTPYRNAWLKKLTPFYLRAYPSETSLHRLAPSNATVASALPTLKQLGFEPVALDTLHIQTGSQGATECFEKFLTRIDTYAQQRDYPAVKGVSYLSVHLRFGTASIRTLARAAYERHSAGALSWLNELIWRDFYSMILWFHPHVVEHAFKPAYERIDWNTDRAAFSAWCEGRTGYPLVDAAMRQLNQSGYMHNRLRMLTASFLTKDLGIDWRWGERYFAQQLIDYDLAANNGGWQWAASTGCDAQPYFRIFNPITQSQRFDPEGQFIKRYLPQLAGFTAKEIHAPWLTSAARQAQVGCVMGRDYPLPIVDHAQARAATLQRYEVVRV